MWKLLIKILYLSKSLTFEVKKEPGTFEVITSVKLFGKVVREIHFSEIEMLMRREEHDKEMALLHQYSKSINDDIKNNSPIGVSQWEVYGRRFGYWDYFKNYVEDEGVETSPKEDPTA